MQWICDICGYQHDDDEPPSFCPICCAAQDIFSEHYGDDGTDISGPNGKDMDDFDRDLFADYEDQ
ncbi:MAG: rubredoxin-like domain-containing protein [bacterium]